MTFLILQKIYVLKKIDLIVLLSFYSSKNPEINIKVFIKKINTTTVFNIDHDNKCFLSTKSSYKFDFMWHWRLE